MSVPTCKKILQNINGIKNRMKEASNRSPFFKKKSDIHPHLVIVTKTRPIEMLECLLWNGYQYFGENYVQEAMAKQKMLDKRNINYPKPIWELIGPLQRKKVRKALQLFWRIHTLDREALAKKISNVAREIRRESVPVLIQVNIDGTKNGIESDEVISFIETVKDLPRLEMQGLMCIAPIGSTIAIRESFVRLRGLRDQVRKEFPELRNKFLHLSMGMTNDFEIAIEEGATIVRIGRAIFSD